MHRRTIELAALLLLVVLGLAACGGSGTPAAAKPPGGAGGDIAKGKELFAGTCAACHGPDARGLPNLGKDLTTSTFVKDQNDQQLVEFIKKGRQPGEPGNTTGVAMPPKGGNPALTDKDLADIVAYIRTLQK